MRGAIENFAWFGFAANGFLLSCEPLIIVDDCRNILSRLPGFINPIVGSDGKSIGILYNIMKSNKNSSGFRSVESDRIRLPRNMEFQ
jgi:hypothetical protein